MECIVHYPRDHVTPELVDYWQVCGLYDESLGLESGLLKNYQNVRDAYSPHRVDGVWIFTVGGKPVGIAMLERRHVTGMHLFVKPQYRRYGYGRGLLLSVMESRVDFQVFYTQTSKRLYERYSLPEVIQDF